MIFISHRGNLNGPNKEMENNPQYISNAIKKGYYVEIDVWYINGDFFLGHDFPEYKIKREFLKNKHFYCHGKNLDAIKELITMKNETNFFSHDLDKYVLTSDNKIWTYPGDVLCENSICCMPEKKYQYPDKCYGVCTDYPLKYKLLYELKYGSPINIPKIKIGASLLSCDLSNLTQECDRIINSGIDFLHFDVMDGNFVDNITFGPLILATIKKYNNHFVDVHLMVNDPIKWIKPFVDAGANNLTFHVESTNNIENVIKSVKENNISCGLAINPETSIQSIENYIELVDIILVMTVKPGFGGQKIIMETIEKIKNLRKLYPNKIIEVDGGINKNNINLLINAGANWIVSGSSLFKFNHLEKNVKNFKEIILKNPKKHFEKCFNYIYKNMRESNINNINNLGLNIDPKLTVKDNRRCLGVSTSLNSKFFNNDFRLMLKDLEKSFKNQIIYDDSDKNSGTLHFSFINIISFDKFYNNENYINKNYDNYKLIIDEIFEPFKIYWKGLIAIPTGICMIGFPDIDINEKRDMFRKNINKKNLKIYERYKSNIVHTTLLRLSKEEGKEKILNFCKKYENKYFGLSEINDIKIVKGSWKASECK